MGTFTKKIMEFSNASFHTKKIKLNKTSNVSGSVQLFLLFNLMLFVGILNKTFKMCCDDLLIEEGSGEIVERSNV